MTKGKSSTKGYSSVLSIASDDDRSSKGKPCDYVLVGGRFALTLFDETAEKLVRESV